MYLSGELDHCRFTRICGLQTPFYLYLLSRCVHKGMELQTLVMSSNGGGGAFKHFSSDDIFSN